MIFPAICEKLIGRIGFGWTVRGETCFFLLAVYSSIHSPLSHLALFFTPLPIAINFMKRQLTNIPVLTLVVFLTLIPVNLIVRERPGQKRPKGKPSFDKTIFKDVPYLLVMAGLGFTFWGVYFGFYYIVSYAQQTLHLSSTQAVNLLILMVCCPLRLWPVCPTFPYLLHVPLVLPSPSSLLAAYQQPTERIQPPRPLPSPPDIRYMSRPPQHPHPQHLPNIQHFIPLARFLHFHKHPSRSGFLRFRVRWHTESV